MGLDDQAFVLTEHHQREYTEQGYTVFRSCLPPKLIADLRATCEELRLEACRQSGPQAQRLTKILHTDVDPTPFGSYAELPSLKKAFRALIGEECEHGTHLFWTPEQEDYHAGHGVMIEPVEYPYCTVWHRDWRDNVNGLSLDDWDRVCTDRRFFNQTNMPLYADSCFWVVPGSHLRRDTPEETALFPDRPIKLPFPLKDSAVSHAELECRNLDYMRSMPGAIQLHLSPGDLCVYRNCLWHAGCYTTTAKRATIHDVPDTPQFQRWRTGRFRRSADAVAAESNGGPPAMENPSKQVLTIAGYPRLTWEHDVRAAGAVVAKL